MMNQSVNWQLNTSGAGLWSDRQTMVKVNTVQLAYMNDDQTFGELRAYFDTKTWSSDIDGLIYTDEQWITEFRGLMRSLGFTSVACSDIEYSEQGMQGQDYVSMDVHAAFMSELEPMYRFTMNREKIYA